MSEDQDRDDLSGRADDGQPGVAGARARWPIGSRTALIVVVACAVVVAGLAILDVPDRLGFDSSSVSGERPKDSDGDGLSDHHERAGWSVPGKAAVRTDPLRADTDADGLADGDELDLSLDPRSRDTDGDGLTDGYEVDTANTAPDRRDTDGDGFMDDFELVSATDRRLDPLRQDRRITTSTYAKDYATGLILGDARRKDSVAWLLGTLTTAGSGFIPIIGQVVGSLADARDLVVSLLRRDWVGAGFSAGGLVPYAGDGAVVVRKVKAFVSRNPHLAATVAVAVAKLSRLPEATRTQIVRVIWRQWQPLRSAGASTKQLTRLSDRGRNLDLISAAIRRPGHEAGPAVKPFADGPAGERFLEDHYRTRKTPTRNQVTMGTTMCRKVCNGSLRRFDVVVGGVAHESKVGQMSLTESIRRQVLSDAYLVRTNRIQAAHWHFFPSDASVSVGATRPLLDLLEAEGIRYTIHMPR